MFLSALKSTRDFSPRPFFSLARRALVIRVLALVTLGIIGDVSWAAPKPMTGAELEKELAQYKNILSLDANFDQVKEIKSLKVKLKSSGTFHLRKAGDISEVEWQVSKPSFLKLKITPASLEIFEEEGKPGRPVVENQEAQAKILRPLYAWLSVSSRLISEQYHIFSLGKKSFRLEPKEENSPVKALRILLDKQKYVSSVLLEERSGDEIRITFSGTKAAHAP